MFDKRCNNIGKLADQFHNFTAILFFIGIKAIMFALRIKITGDTVEIIIFIALTLS